MTISGTPQQMRLSQTGFAFSAIEGSTAVSAARSLQVSNTGTGMMNWRASVQTLSGSNWLQVSPLIRRVCRRACTSAWLR